MPGPIPKRDAASAGHKTKANRARKVAFDSGVVMPPADPDWEPEASRLYTSLSASAIGPFLEPSDWEFARMNASRHTAELRKTKQSAMMWTLIYQGWERLGATENARRRMRVEGSRPPADAGDDTGVGSATLDRFARLAEA